MPSPIVIKDSDYLVIVEFCDHSQKIKRLTINLSLI